MGTWELGLGLQSGTWACRGAGYIGDFVIGEFLSRKRLSGTWAIGLTSCSRLQHGYCIGVSRRSAQATAGKGLAQGPYMAGRAGVEPTTLRLKAIDSTKAPPCPTIIL